MKEVGKFSDRVYNLEILVITLKKKKHCGMGDVSEMVSGNVNHKTRPGSPAWCGSVD